MKRFFATALSALLVFSLAACGGAASSSKASSAPAAASQADFASTSTSAPAGGAVYNIAISMNALDEYQTEWLSYYQGYLEGLGHKVTVSNAESKVDKQISDVEALIQNKPDVIVIKAVDQDGVVPAFEACDAAGIPSIDSDMGANTDIPLHLTSDQRELGVLIGEYSNEWLAKNPDETIRAGYLIGVQFPSVMGRMTGWMDTIEEAGNGERFELLAEKVANWSATEAMAIVEDWMQAYPDMNWIVAMSDEMAIAAVNVVEAAGKSGQIVICGVDGSPNAQAEIRAGRMAGSSFVPRRQMAQTTADYTLRVAGGEFPALAGTTVDIGEGLRAFLTIDNIDEILAKYA